MVLSSRFTVFLTCDFSCPVCVRAWSMIPQRSILYVYDLKALNHIVVKDQNIWEESSVFLTSVAFSLVIRPTYINFRIATRTNLLAIGPSLVATLGMRVRTAYHNSTD